MMDKKSIIGLSIIAVILLGFSVFNSNEQAKIDREKARMDSIEMVRLAAAVEEASKMPTAPAVISQGESDSSKIEKSVYQEQLSTSLGDSLYASMSGEEQFYTVENDLMVMKFSTKGGRVASVMLKDYKRYNGEPLYLFREESSSFNMSFFTNQQINTSDFYFTPVKAENIVLTKGDESQQFAMRLYADSLSYVEYQYTIHPDQYMVDFNINLVGMDKKIAQNQSDFIIKMESIGLQNEKGFENENNYTTIAYMYPGEDSSLEELGMSKSTKDEDINSRVKWVAFKQQFFSTIMIAKEGFENAAIKYETFQPNSDSIKRFNAQLALAYSPQVKEYSLQYYFGPNSFNTLRKYDLGIQKLVPLGGWMIGWINRYVVIPTFDLLGKHIANYGLIILILTILIKIIISPLTYKSYLSMAKMRVLKPELDELAKKYPNKDDAMKKQQATMEMYRAAGVNPMGGCLPLLIQFPILIAMFRFFPASIELRGKSFLWADDLSSYDSILNLPFDIPFYGSHVSLFTLLMAVSIFISSRISYNQSSATAAPQMAGMKFMMLYMMPAMMIFWFNNYSSGLSYYYLLSNIITIGQTYGFRYIVNEDKLHRKMKENAKKPKKKSKFMQRYEDAMKQQQEVTKNQRKR